MQINGAENRVSGTWQGVTIRERDGHVHVRAVHGNQMVEAVLTTTQALHLSKVLKEAVTRLNKAKNGESK